MLGDVDRFLFNEGRHLDLFDRLGAHPVDGGVHFAVWAPNASKVAVIGSFNGWDPSAHPLAPSGESGIWTGVVRAAGPGDVYKYRIEANSGYVVDKADPFAFATEVPPKTGSVVWEQQHVFEDELWMATRKDRQAFDAPISIYELHLGSWRKGLTYRSVVEPLIAHVKSVGFTHVELLPIMEHPFYGSWGYQTTGYFAPTSRYGTPDDFAYLVDRLHQADIGVILDWVPSHFPTDEFSLAFFDGTHLFEHADPRQGYHPDWNSAIFNYGRNEVRSFLLSSALFWLERFHADGIRVDAVASMLYLDYSRKQGEWIPNIHGGRENLEAIEFLRQLNTAIKEKHPDTLVMAEESTAWPMVSRPAAVGGLGFDYKWDMGWMHDTLAYMSRDPVHRKYEHNQITFRPVYAGSENFVLPLSHDEVVHGKGSLLGKMPGDDWQKRANLRLLFANHFTTPGKKLLFMGGEIGQQLEWNHESSLQWSLLEHEEHGGLMRLVGDLNRLYKDSPALHDSDCDPTGFAWLDCSDIEQSVVSFLRRSGDDLAVLVFNFTPVPRPNYRIGVPRKGTYNELLNTDARIYGGSGVGNLGAVDSTPIPKHGHQHSLNLTLPPLAALLFEPS